MRENTAHLRVQTISFPGGRKVGYIQAGSGPDLVVVNGLFQRSSGLRWLINNLAPYFRVTCLVVPGAEGSSPLPHSDKETVTCLVHDSLLALGIKKPVITTISLGSAIGIPYLDSTQAQAMQVEALVVYDPVTRVGDTALRWQVLFRLNHILSKLKLSAGFHLLVWFIRSALLVTRRRIARKVRDMPLRSFSQVGELVYNNEIDSLAVRVSTQLPTMCVASVNGSTWLINRKSIKEMMDSMHFSEFCYLQDSEHILQPENQQELAEKIVVFAKELGII